MVASLITGIPAPGAAALPRLRPAALPGAWRPGAPPGAWRPGAPPGPWGALSGRWGTPDGRRTWQSLENLATAPITPTALTTHGSPWQALPATNPVMPNGNLTADSCTSPTACTAVGGYEDNFGTELALAERWNGTRWALQRAPNPAGALWTSLYGVSCASSDACTADGYYLTGTGNLAGFAERWDGTHWSVQPTPSPRKSQSGLFAISCPLANSCMAAGLYATPVGNLAPLAELWNGVRWRILRVPVPAASQGAEFGAVSCVAASACTAAGDYGTFAGADATLAEQWNGARWTITPTPNPAGSFGSQLTAVSCRSARACTAAGAYAIDYAGDAEPLAEAWNGTTWRVQATPYLPQPTGAHGGGGVFSAVSCATPHRCAAVGTYLRLGKQPERLSLTERWNGTRWRLQAGPDPAHSLGTGLSGIACPSAATCIAAGGYPVVESISTIEGTVQPTQTLAEVWRSSRWHIQPSANRGGATVDDDLSAVSCTSARLCTAVGTYTGVAGNTPTQAERWNGSAWTTQPTPSFKGSFDTELNDVSCASPRACTAVGDYSTPAFSGFALAERWNGSDWVVQPIPHFPGATNAALLAVSCPTARACTAVGSSGKNVPLTARWNGIRWTAQPSPRPGGSELIGVSCASARACVAVGERSTGGKTQATLAEHWNGTRWTITPTPNPPGAPIAELHDVSCSAPRQCTAIGAFQLSNGRERTLAERWNGSRWTIQPTQNRSAGAELSGVSCASASTCTAVGQYFLPNGATWMLIEAWNGTRWVAEPTPALTAYDSGLARVSCAKPGACTAVGYYFGLTGFSLNLSISTSARTAPAR